MLKYINYKVVINVISRNLLILSAAFIGCILLALHYNESVMPFVKTLAFSLSTGAYLFLRTRRKTQEVQIKHREAYLTVTMSWLILSLVGTLPFIFSGYFNSFIDAFFESVSGFTTTGSSILTNIEALPKSILFWRSTTHWIGGIGIIVLVIVVMPSLQMGGYQLFTLESSLQEKIRPKAKSIGIRLIYIYLSLTVLEIIFLLFGKMSLYDSVCHTFGTIATGGFSPKNTSIIDYSPYIQYVIMIFMLLAGTNFIIHYYLVKGEYKKVRDNEELRIYLFLTFFIGALITAILYFDAGKPFELSFRESFFQVISTITCTGYASADYMLWPHYAWIIIFLSMFLGGSTGSTAGGIKMARHLVIFKNLLRHIRKLASPNALFPLRINNRIISDEANNSIMSFVSIYILVFIVGNILLLFCGLDPKSSVSAVATCMAGIGPGLGEIGPAGNFAHLNDITKLILTLLMLLGRLEIYTIFVLFTRSYWYN